MIEAVTGEPYATIVAPRGHRPARARAHGRPSSTRPARRSTRPATARSPTPTRGSRSSTSTPGRWRPPTGFFSTAEDLCRYMSAHFLGDERLLGDRAKRLMQRTEWQRRRRGTGYGLGFEINEIGDRRLIGHGGGYPGHITAPCSIRQAQFGRRASSRTRSTGPPRATGAGGVGAGQPGGAAGEIRAGARRRRGRPALRALRQPLGRLDIVRLGDGLYASTRRRPIPRPSTCPSR